MCDFSKKKALTRPVGEHSAIPYVKELEEEMLEKNQPAWNRTGWTWRNNHCSRSECEYLRDTYCRTSGGSQYLLSCE